MGKIVIQRKVGKASIIEEVLFVLGMKCNLMSVGQLIENGFSVVMKNNGLQLFDSRQMLILKSPLSRNRTFQTSIKLAQVECLSTRTDKGWLWHLKFDHLNFRSLSQLHNDEMVIGLPRITSLDKSCESCMLGKQARLNFNPCLRMRVVGPQMLE